jgi:hypothetical protein
MLHEEVLRDFKGGFPYDDVTAKCRICGQVTTIRIQSYRTEEEQTELATELCGCEGAKKYYKIKQSNEKLEEAIRYIFDNREMEEEYVEAIKQIGKGILNGRILKARFEIPARIRDEPKETLTFSDKDGLLKINISQKRSEDINL